MKKVLLLVLLMISIPAVIINLFFELKLEKIISGFFSNDKTNHIRVLTSNNSILNLDLEDYLIGVVSAEVPISFEEEAIKAQAVAARTYALKQIQNSKDRNYDVTDDVKTQVYQSDEDLKKKWGNNYDKYIKKVKKCISDTKGEYVSYNDEIIYAFFFSTSNGYTEDNVNVFGQDLPYLKMVNSSFDETETTSFTKEKYFSLEEFYNLLKINYSDKLIISDVNKSQSGRVISLKINGNYFKGRDFQQKLSLRSTDFTVTQNSTNIKIVTKGYGHGVGMSQYGANALAKQNKNYTEILKYYYTGTKIKKI